MLLRPPHTQRLRLREFSPADLDDVFRLDSDPRVMRYVGDGRVATRKSVGEALSRAAPYYRNYPGLGVWPAEERVSGKWARNGTQTAVADGLHGRNDEARFLVAE